MIHTYRRTVPCWLISQALCFCLLLQGSGIAQALPLPPKQTFVSKDELQAARLVEATTSSETDPLERFATGAWATARATGDYIQGQIQDWFENSWAPGVATGGADPPLRVAQAGGVLPLPSRLMPAFFATTTQGPGGPPNPPGFAGGTTEATPPARDNMTLEIDPLGHRTQFFYDADNNLVRSIDPELNETRFTYNSRGQVLTTTDPRGKVVENRYDALGNLTYTKDPTGAETAWTYDASGNLQTETDAGQNVTTYEHDSFGNTTRVINALGHATDSTYDANANRLTETTTRTLPDGSTETLVTTHLYDGLDRLTEVIAPDATSTRTRYDALGKVVETIDQLQRSTLFDYDDMGRLERTQYPDQTEELHVHDDEGQLIQQTDRAGRPTLFEYDPVGRQTKTTFADQTYTLNRYDDAGRLIEVEDERRNVTRYTYDAAGQRTKITDALGGVTDFEHDPAGNQTAVVDPNRHRTQFEYDDAGRLVRTIFPDLTDSHVAYDALGRRISETDQAGNTTQFRYDALGRLVKVIDALLQETDYVYDELGNRTQQIDANDHVTRFEYDALGRQTARILPGDDRESMAFHADGTLASHTDFNGSTRAFSYDSNRRLIRRAYPDGSEVRFTYTATGQRKTVLDARGTTSYSYGPRDRLTEKVDPTGYKLSYTYDAAGNRTSLTATIGAEVYTTAYSHDALNRVATVIDSQGGTTTLGYDANGNQGRLEHPNGVTTSYTYDALNRLAELRTETSAGGVLQRYEYTLGLAGNRTRIDEHDGTSRHYTYDDTYRLTQDRVMDPADALVYQRDFVYDPVGNRLEQTIEEGAGPSVDTSTYDARDRLLKTARLTFGWDDNGNLTSQDSKEYRWDSNNRLVSADSPDGTLIATTYDVDGNRVQTTITATDGTSTDIDFLVDSSDFLSHVVAEVISGSVQILYTRADDELLALHRPTTSMSRYYHADGLGSVRALSDKTENATDRYTYTAFGQLLSHDGSSLQPYMFAGEPFGEKINRYYNRARWLDVRSGTFLSMDPAKPEPEKPSLLHRYSYATSNPVTYFDPSGTTSIQLPSVLTALAAFALVTVTVLPRFPNFRYQKRTRTVIAYRGIKRKVSPSTFRFDDDGLSVRETPSTTHPENLPFIIKYRGWKWPGRWASVEKIGGFPVRGFSARYTPWQGGLGHWSVTFYGGGDTGKKVISDLAKKFLKRTPTPQ